MHLMKPTVMLAMMDDPKWGAMMKEVYETVGLRNKRDQDLTALDQMAGYQGKGLEQGVDYQGFREQLEARELAYKTAADQLALSLPGSESEELGNFMFAEVQREVMVPYLELYYDSFFSNEMVALVTEIRALQRQMHPMILASEVPPGLLQQYMDLIKKMPRMPKR